MNALALVLPVLLGALDADPSCELASRFDAAGAVKWTSCGRGCERLDVERLPGTIPSGVFDVRADGDRIAFTRELRDGFALTVVDVKTARVVFEARREALASCRVEVVGFEPDGLHLMVWKKNAETRYFVDLRAKTVTALGGTTVERGPLEITTGGGRLALTRDRRSIELDARLFAPAHPGFVVGARFARDDLLYARVKGLGGGRLFALRGGVETPVAGVEVVAGVAVRKDTVAYFERTAAGGWFLTAGRYDAGAIREPRPLRAAVAPTPGVLGEGVVAHGEVGRVVLTNLHDRAVRILRPPAPLTAGTPLVAAADEVLVPLYAPAAWRRSGRVAHGRAFGVARLTP